MPRPPRRAAAQARPDQAATPTRPQTNAITAAIPPFMLETPPHAPFLTTPLPPSNNPGESIVPEDNLPRRNVRFARQNPPNGGSEDDPDRSRVQSGGLSSNLSDPTNADEQSLLDSMQAASEDVKALQGLRDICSLATWTLSSAKPGCALAQLRYPSPLQFWQSDGPQPHTLTLHFFKLVSIVKMRIYLDFQLDESYTPTKMHFFAGMSEGGLVEFGSWEAQDIQDPVTGETHSTVESIQGWLDIPLQGVGGYEKPQYDSEGGISGNGLDEDELMTGLGEDRDDLMGGNVLKAMIVQVQICENHQNGKDTHVRGFQVFARDEVGSKEMRQVVKKHRPADLVDVDHEDEEIFGLQPAEWMGDPEIR